MWGEEKKEKEEKRVMEGEGRGGRGDEGVRRRRKG